MKIFDPKDAIWIKGSSIKLPVVMTGKQINLWAEHSIIDGKRPIKEEKYLYGETTIGVWNSYKTYVFWNVIFPEPGQYEVYLNYASKEASEITIQAGKESLTSKLKSTDGWGEFEEIKPGILNIDKKGTIQIKVKPTSKETWKAINLYYIKIIPK